MIEYNLHDGSAKKVSVNHLIKNQNRIAWAIMARVASERSVSGAVLLVGLKPVYRSSEMPAFGEVAQGCYAVIMGWWADFRVMEQFIATRRGGLQNAPLYHIGWQAAPVGFEELTGLLKQAKYSDCYRAGNRKVFHNGLEWDGISVYNCGANRVTDPRWTFAVVNVTEKMLYLGNDDLIPKNMRIFGYRRELEELIPSRLPVLVVDGSTQTLYPNSMHCPAWNGRRELTDAARRLAVSL